MTFDSVQIHALCSSFPSIIPALTQIDSGPFVSHPTPSSTLIPFLLPHPPATTAPSLSCSMCPDSHQAKRPAADHPGDQTTPDCWALPQSLFCSVCLSSGTPPARAVTPQLLCHICTQLHLCSTPRPGSGTCSGWKGKTLNSLLTRPPGLGQNIQPRVTTALTWVSLSAVSLKTDAHL